MNIILSEEASSYYCCQMNQPCQGNKCMAWIYYYETVRESGTGKTGIHAILHPISELRHIPTGKGYCGMVSHKHFTR